MELKVKKDLLHISELMFENTAEQSVDGDITLPDYCPDIKRILKCIVTPCIVSEQCVGDRVTIDANAFVQVIYVDDNNKIFCYDKTFPFSKTVETGKNINNPVAEVRMKTAYANTRAVSQRRIDIHASVAISISITSKKEFEVISEASDCGIQLLKNFNYASDYVGKVVKTFTLNEIMEIGKSKSPVKQIIRQNAIPSLDEVKVINNKLLLKGEVKIFLFYCADSDNGSYEIYENSLPLNQIIEFEGIDEKTKQEIRIYISSFSVLPKSNTSGEKTLFDVNIQITSLIKAVKDIDQTFPTDCYSTEYNVEYEKKQATFETIFDTSEELIMIKKNEEFTNTNIGKILNLWCDDVITTYACSGDELKIIGSTTVSILGMDTDDQPFYAERIISFEKSKNISGGCKDLICTSDGIVNGVSFILTDNNHIDLRVEIRLNNIISKRCTAELLTNINIDESKIKEKKYSALTIYFCDGSESLWNIARKYNTTIDAIKTENDITESRIRENSMILIPCM